MVYAQPRTCLGEWDAKAPLGFWHTNNGTSNLGQTTRPCSNQQKKKKKRKKRENLPNRRFCCPDWPQSKNERKTLLENWKKNLLNMKMAIMQIEIGAHWYRHQRIGRRTWRLGNIRRGGHHPNYCIGIGQNTSKSTGDWGDLQSLKLLGETTGKRWWEILEKRIKIKLQERRKEEDLSALKTVLTHQYNDSRTT